MADDRASRFPGGVNTQLVTAIVVALGIGGGGGSLLAQQASPDLARLLDERSEAARLVFATKLEVADLKGELALINQALGQVSDQLDAVSAQLEEVEKQLRR